MDRLEAQPLAFDGRDGKRLARRSVDHPARDLDQPRSTRVDDAGVAKDVEHLGRARQRILSAGQDRGQELRGRQPPVLRPLSLLGHLADHREDRPLDRALDCAVGRVAGTAKGTAEPRCRDVVRLAEIVDEPPHDLGEDDTRVAACP